MIGIPFDFRRSAFPRANAHTAASGALLAGCGIPCRDTWDLLPGGIDQGNQFFSGMVPAAAHGSGHPGEPGEFQKIAAFPRNRHVVFTDGR